MTQQPDRGTESLETAACEAIASLARIRAESGAWLGAAERARMFACIEEAEPGRQQELTRALLSACDPAALAPVAHDLLHDQSDFVRDAASDALAEMPHDGHPDHASAARAALAEALDDDHRDVRWYATEALAREHTPDTIPLLVDRLRDAEFSIRWTAGNGLIEAGSASIVPVLQALAEGETSPLFHGAARRIMSRVSASGPLADELAELVDRMGRMTAVYDVQPQALELLHRLRGDRRTDGDDA